MQRILRGVLPVFLVGVQLHARGQQHTSADPLKPEVEKVLTSALLNYRGGAVQQERGLGPQSTFLAGVGAHFSSYSTNSPPLFGSRFINVTDKYFGRHYTTSGWTPYVFAEFRVYTTLDKRAVHGRDTRANSSNYWALAGEVPFASGNLINVPNLELAYPVGVKYGVRRPLGTALYIEGSLGGFLKISRSQQSLSPRLDVALGLHQ
ncbi:hypothetical protein GCM10022409_02410 [Hymenobacter glaciei]|uniref:Outer membrane protein beta-barrel domain-containing protein n=1 Tax=Hymenobacter glaciei TaxID=877209 RepID=A0ABP7T7W1_9BACT